MYIFLGIYIILLGLVFIFLGRFVCKKSKAKQGEESNLKAYYLVIFMGVLTVLAGIFTAVSG